MKKLCLLALVACCIAQSALSQGEIPVDMHTGTPSIQIPLWTVADHDLSVPVSMIYNVSDVKLPDVSDGRYGVGWILSCNENKITREVKGLPDDIYETGGSSRRGWIYQNTGGTTVAADIGNFTASADASAATCTDETADNTKLSSLNYTIDTEPDIFWYSAGGYSGSFVFDNASTPSIRLIPWQDVKITYTINDYRLASFTIKTNTGQTYTFSIPATNTKSTVKDESVTSVDILPAEYEFYKTSVTYNYAWNLSRIQSSSGAYIDYTYTDKEETPRQDVRIGIYNQSNNTPLTKIRLKTLYTINETTILKFVNVVKASSGAQLVFSYEGEALQKIFVHDLRRAAGTTQVKEFNFTYFTARALGRKFLSTITEAGKCQKMPPYSFTYVADVMYPSMNDGAAKDIWGYYNGKSANEHLVPKLYVYPDEPAQHRVRLYPIPGYSGTQIILDGADRTPSPQHTAVGTLSEIKYPAGGIAYIQYEPNMYYDSRASKNQYGGGVRVKRITHYDGVNSAGTVSKTFDYADPVTGQSYGRIVDFPSFLVPSWKFKNPDYYNNLSYDIAYNASFTPDEQWKRYTSRTELDLNEQNGAPVRYQFVTVRRSGSGSAKFEYAVPGQYGDAATGQWTPVVNKFARPSACPVMGIFSAGSAWVYPYSLNPNFEADRGMQLRKYEYNESGTLVRLTENTYQDIYPVGATQPAKVWGLRYNKYGYSDNIFVYGKYYLLTDYTKVPLKETVTTYDATSQGKNIVTSTDFLYESTAHRLLTATKSTQPDGVVYTTRVKYPLDFGTVQANSDAAFLQIKYLQENNRNGEPVEVVNYIQKPADSLRVVSAQLTKYKNFSVGGVLPAEALALRVTSPISNFQASTALLQNGTYVLKPDSHYELSNTVAAYNAYGHIVSATGTSKISQASAWGYNGALPVVQAVNAGDNGTVDFAFSDFETSTGFEFAVANGYYGTGRTGTNALHPYATLSKVITKATGALNYNVVLWLKNDSATPVILRVKVKDQSQATVYYNDTIKVIPTAGAYKFVRKVIPVTAAPSIFWFEMTGEGIAQPSASVPGLLPVIDDVAFYAEKARLVSYTYELPFGVASATDLQKGVTGFTTYNDLGAPELALDQDRNIVSRNTYSYTSVPVLDSSFTSPSAPVAQFPLTFYAFNNPCIDGETYFWDFGTGTFTAGSSTITTSFAAGGTYTVRLKVTSPGYADVISTQELIVQPPPILVGVCTKGVKEYGCATLSTFTPCALISGNTASFTYFKVSYQDQVPANPTYKWKMRNVGTVAWLDVGPNADEYSYKVLPNSASIEVRCEISAPGWATTTTEIETVTVYPCN